MKKHLYLLFIIVCSLVAGCSSKSPEQRAMEIIERDNENAVQLQMKVQELILIAYGEWEYELQTKHPLFSRTRDVHSKLTTMKKLPQIKLTKQSKPKNLLYNIKYRLPKLP